MQNKLTTAEIVIVIAGAVALIGSFLDWYDISGFGGGSAWSDEMLFPTFAWVGIFGAVMALQVVLSKLANVQFPGNILGFTWPQIHLVLAVFAALLVVSFLIGGDELAIGFFLSLLAAIGLVVGAVMLQGERRGSPASGL